MVDVTKLVKIAKLADAAEAARAARAARTAEKMGEATQATRATQSNKLAEVFKASAVKDAQGNPLKVFTGTSKDIDFSTFKIPKNGAWFTEDSAEASRYAMDNESMGLKSIPGTWKFEEINKASRVMPVYLDIRNPKIYQDSSEFNDIIAKLGGENYKKGQSALFDKLRFEGYDGVVLGKEKGKRVWVVIDKPNQIKSAIGNSGEYDLSKKSMIQGAAGAAVVSGAATQEETPQ